EDQTFTYTLAEGAGYTVDPAQNSGTFTVTDGVVPATSPTVGVTASETTLIEDEQTRTTITFTTDGDIPAGGLLVQLKSSVRAIAEFDVNASNPRNEPVTIEPGPVITGGTIVGTDEVAGSVFFRITDPTASIDIAVFDDDVAEGTENLSFSLVDGEDYEVDAANSGFDITIEDESASNEILGTNRSETLRGTDGDDVIRALAGNDKVFAKSGNDTVEGGDGHDTIFGDDGDDTISGGDRNDRLFGNAGNDTLNGDDGNDRLNGGDGDDTLNGGNRDDQLVGKAGNDTLNGDDGNDRLFGDDGDDTLNGGDRNDQLVGGDGNDTLNGDAGRDSLFGGNGDDVLSGGDDNDQLVGGNGDDTLNSGANKDRVFGGNGNDIIDGGAGRDLLYGNQNNDIIFGGADNDRIFGGSGNDILSGDAGRDIITGNSGDDILMGVTGNDVLTGGSGSDVFVFGNGDGTDTVKDFKVGTDKIGLVEGELTFSDLTFEQRGRRTFLGVASTGETLAILDRVTASSLTESSFITVPDVSTLEEALTIL
ncbi:MAG: calcium-binding protein, partial [Cyanobacteria bacterium P01_F01_bin.53]